MAMTGSSCWPATAPSDMTCSFRRGGALHVLRFFLKHKAAQFHIHLHRNMDAANANKPGRVRRTAAQLYRLVQNSVQRVVDLRWALACCAGRTDGGRALQRFRKVWEAPGWHPKSSPSGSRS